MVDPILNRSADRSCWIPAGAPVVIGDMTITAGLFYCGTASEAIRFHLNSEPSFVRTDLSLQGGIPFASPLGTSFADLPPARRLQYVRWLANGRPTASRWLIDLFVSGIERRWSENQRAIGDEELTGILEELRRLATYPEGADAASLHGFILAECRQSGRLDAPLVDCAPTFPNPDGGLTLAVLRDCAQQSLALPADWAVAALLRRIEPVADLEDLSRLIEVRQLFEIRYNQRFGTGVTPRATPDTGHFYFSRVPRNGIRCVTYAVAESARLALDHCWEELDGLARQVLKDAGMYRQRVSGITDLDGRINKAGGLLPLDLGRVYADAVLMRLHDRLKSHDAQLIIATRDLASVWPTGGLGLVPFTLSNLAALLELRGFRLEPHPTYTSWQATPEVFSICRCEQVADDRWKEVVLLKTAQQSRGLGIVTQQLANDLAGPGAGRSHSHCLRQLFNHLPARDRIALTVKADSDPNCLSTASKFLSERNAIADIRTPRSTTANPIVNQPALPTATVNLAATEHDAELEELLRRFQRETMLRRQSRSS